MIRQGLVIVVLALMAGGFLLVWDSPPESFIRQTTSPTDETPQADSYMTAVTSRRFSVLGNQQFSLSSPRINFYEGQSTLTLEQPQFVSNGDIRYPLQLSADSGELDNDKLDLRGTVRAEITTEEGPALLTTEQLSYLIESAVASTEQPFTLTQPKTNVSGTGLKADLRNETFAIQSRVRVTHEPQ